ncbi:MAG: O-antigen ligase family protein [Candidatus Omnitrophica bacterium]|nr:O-antigen ligase family protein [Candidatus Omnitrophota bacterium]
MIRNSLIVRWMTAQRQTASPIGTSVFSAWSRACLRPVQRHLMFLQGRKTTTFLCWLTSFLLLSVIFVPRIPLGIMNDYYRVDLKAEDLLLFVLGIFLMMRFLSAPCGRSEVKRSFATVGGLASIENAYLFFLLMCQISIASGLYMHTIDKPLMSMLYLVKWLEYGLVFLIVAALCETRATGHFFTVIFFVLGIVSACYGYWEHFFPAAKAVYPNYYRLYERYPFHGDANHMGCFLVVWLCFFSGFFIKENHKWFKTAVFAALLFVFFPFIWTYSRKSYFSFAGAMGLALLIPGSRKQTVFLISTFILAALLLPTRLAERMTDIVEVLQSEDPFHSSWAGNVDMWKRAFVNFNHFFIFGSGFGSRHRLFYESQYVLILSETGMAGALAFGGLILSLVRHVAVQFKNQIQPWQSRLGWGWLIALAAMLIHNISCVSWMVSKAAIPFWFLTGYVMKALILTEPEND